ncbi:helix-turn-helix domain-containing protein [Microbulbifer taiwanensis]|uniref:helix-turn-helix domain-containing protein n=1 Tax=Microbulbifer taiwanensis TaxID=986746 RepID=UPI00360A05E6
MFAAAAESEGNGARLHGGAPGAGVARAWGAKISPLALELGVNESCISRWRRGGAISTDNAIRLCRALDISLDWLLSGRGHMDQHKGRAVSDREFLLLARMRSLPEKVRETLLSLLETISDDT